MKKFNVIVLAFALAFSCLGTSFAESLSLDDCVNRAISKNPELQQALANVKTAEAQKKLAAVARRFKLEAGATFDYTNGITTSSLLKQTNNAQGRAGFGISAQQLIYDSGKSHLEITAAERYALSTQQTYDEMKNQIIARVYSAYYNLNKATRQKGVAQTRYDNYNERLFLAQNFYRVGSKPKIEVTKAESDLAAAQLGVVETKTNEQKCQAELANAIGEPLLDVTAAQDALAFKSWKIDLSQAVDQAMANRYEIKAQELKLASAEATLLLKKKGLTPDLYLTGGLDRGAEAFSDRSYLLEGNEGWRIGAQFVIPILDGGKTSNEIRKAQAQLENEKAALDRVKNDVTLEVRTAWVALEQAEESINAASEQERFAKDTLTLAKIRYRAGAGDNLEISDAIEGLSKAQTNVINSLFNCKNSIVSLKKAMGEYK